MKKVFKFLGLFSACAGVTLTLASCGSNTMTYTNESGEQVTTTVTATNDSAKTAEAVYAVGQSYSEATVAENVKAITAAKANINDKAVITVDGKEAMYVYVKGELIEGLTGDIAASGNLDFEVRMTTPMSMNMKGSIKLTSKDKVAYLDGSYTTKVTTSSGETSQDANIKYSLDTSSLSSMAGSITSLIPAEAAGSLNIESTSVSELSKTIATALSSLTTEDITSAVSAYGIYVAGASNDTITFGATGDSIKELFKSIVASTGGEADEFTESSTVDIKVGFSTKYYLPTELSFNANLVDASNEKNKFVASGTNTIAYGSFTVAEPSSTEGYTDIARLFGSSFSGFGGLLG